MKFIVPGEIKGKARAYTTTNKYTGKTHSFTPKATVHYEDLIRWCYKEAGGEYLGDVPIDITVTCYFHIPTKYKSKKKRQMCLDYEIFPDTKPDWDNVGKIVCDALNGIAYKDDKSVAIGNVDKRWSDGDDYVVVDLIVLNKEKFMLYKETMVNLVKKLQEME